MAAIHGNILAREREYLFIDGGCLRGAVKKICLDVFGDENAYQPLVSSVAEGKFDKVYYYDAVPGKNHREPQAAYEARVQPDHDRFSQIQALDRVHIALGQIVGKDRRQKGVDVRLAVDMMTHAFRGNITRATLFAGDADFVPLIKALVAEGLQVTLWHPPQANAELKGAADSTRPFDFRTDHQCLTENGTQPAFQRLMTGSGLMEPAQYGLQNVVERDNGIFAGRWKDEVLEIWKKGVGSSWEFIKLSVPGSSLIRSLIAFDHIHDWGVASTGEQWIEN